MSGIATGGTSSVCSKYDADSKCYWRSEERSEQRCFLEGRNSTKPSKMAQVWSVFGAKVAALQAEKNNGSR